MMKSKFACAVAVLILMPLLMAQNVECAGAEIYTSQNLNLLLPGEQDLQGVTRTSPAGEFGGSKVFSNGRWIGQEQSGAVIPDEVELNVDLSRRCALRDRKIVNPWQGHYDEQKRTLFSADGLYRIGMSIWLCDSPMTAQQALEEYHSNSSAVYHAGTLSGAPEIGNASWGCAEYLPDKSLLYKAGNIVVLVNSGPTHTALSQGLSSAMPDVAIEALAYQVLLRASQQPKLTGVTAQAARLAVNGRALPKGALKVAGRVYVPIQEFAKAMGLTSRWNTKTGALTLSGPKQKAVALTAGSTAATIGGVNAAALAVPVLKQGGQPVMALSDLLRLTGGRVTS